MNTAGTEEGKKSYKTISGPFAWLADIEITREPYLISFALMVLSVVLSRCPFYEVSAFGTSVSYAFHEVPELTWISTAIVVLNAAAMCALLFPMLKFFEWKYIWFIPTAATAVAELCAVLYYIVKVKDALNNTAVGVLYDVLSAEVKVTFAGWMLVVALVALLVCSVKMLLDIKENNEKYY